MALAAGVKPIKEAAAVLKNAWRFIVWALRAVLLRLGVDGAKAAVAAKVAMAVMKKRFMVVWILNSRCVFIKSLALLISHFVSLVVFLFMYFFSFCLSINFSFSFYLSLGF